MTCRSVETSFFIRDFYCVKITNIIPFILMTFKLDYTGDFARKNYMLVFAQLSTLSFTFDNLFKTSKMFSEILH